MNAYANETTVSVERTRAEQYKQIGNGVSVPVGEWAGREWLRYFGRAA